MKLVIFFLLVASQTIAQMPVNIVVRGIEKAQGNILIRIQDEKENVIKEGIVPAKKGSIEVEWSIPKRTKIAVWVVHDLNKSGDVDKNMFGIPSEPWGISGAKRPSMRGPLVSEMLVNPQQPITIEVR